MELKKFLQSTTVRLALSYLLIIMLMSLSFSFVFYKTSSNELGRQFPTRDFYRTNLLGQPLPEVDQFLQTRIDEGRDELLARLIIVNLLALLAGSVVSYLLARRTLEPIEAAIKAQNRFVSDASHELRTPLTAIQTANEVALRKPKLTVKEAKEVIQNNVEDATKLKDLTDGLLSLAKNDDAVPLQTGPVSAQEVVNEAMNRVVSMAQRKKITVQDDVPEMSLLGDKITLVQVLVILLDNAIKYSPASSTIYLEGSQKAKRAFLSVRDEGVGIKASDLPHIFDRFYRADDARSKTKQNEGYGLGLSIAKKIIDQHGGAITADSKPGHGATFTIELSFST